MCHQHAKQLEELSEVVSDFINEGSLIIERIITLSRLSAHIDGQDDGLKGAVALLETIEELARRCEDTVDSLSEAQNRIMSAA